GGLTSLWPMPFSSGARLELTNDGASAVDPVFYQVTYYDSLPPGTATLLRFHAQWRRENPTQAEVPYTILETIGTGHYVGVSLAMQNRTWWLRPPLSRIAFPSGLGMGILEGWLSAYVDGEEEPSVRGTGVEDDFNGGWYNLPDGRIAAPYHGCTYSNVLTGRAALYRFDVGAPLPFTSSLRVTVDHGFKNQIVGDYSSVAFWYQDEPHQEFAPLPAAAARRPVSPLPNLAQAALFLGTPLAILALLVAAIAL
ncbi:MAG: DUF2961 domain-containing protein, partial [Anaerolineales bacterium]